MHNLEMVANIRNLLKGYIPPEGLQIRIHHCPVMNRVEVRVVVLNDKKYEKWVDGYCEVNHPIVCVLSTIADTCGFNCLVADIPTSVQISTLNLGWAFVRL